MAFMLNILQVALMTLAVSYGADDIKTICMSNQLPATKIINSLSFNLEEKMDTKGNYFFSPLSISVALGMVYIGARGSTREEMSKALEYDIVGKNCQPDKVSESFKELIQSLQNNGSDYELLVANGVFMQMGLQVSRYYSDNLQRHFKSEIQFLNFQSEEKASVNAINEWVANHTKGKIPQLLAEPLLPETLMVLMNAVYFKGLWEIQFDEKDTEDNLFYKLDKSEKQMPFMNLESLIYNYYDPEREYTIIELEYMGGNISMILILPKNRNEFPRYELTNELLCELRGKFQYTPVNVKIPKFNLEFQRELSKDMDKLGVTELFTDKADLSSIHESSDLHVSLMVHKAIIEVNEKGSTAAAAIGMEIGGRHKISDSESFVANHPFLFYIIHNYTNTILFSGRVVDP